MFRRSAMTGLWYEEKKLFLNDGEGIDRYGWQVNTMTEKASIDTARDLLAT